MTARVDKPAATTTTMGGVPLRSVNFKAAATSMLGGMILLKKKFSTKNHSPLYLENVTKIGGFVFYFLFYLIAFRPFVSFPSDSSLEHAFLRAAIMLSLVYFVASIHHHQHVQHRKLAEKTSIRRLVFIYGLLIISVADGFYVFESLQLPSLILLCVGLLFFKLAFSLDLRKESSHGQTTLLQVTMSPVDYALISALLGCLLCTDEYRYVSFTLFLFVIQFWLVSMSLHAVLLSPSFEHQCRGIGSVMLLLSNLIHVLYHAGVIWYLFPAMSFTILYFGAQLLLAVSVLE